MTDKDKLRSSSKLISSFDPGTLDTGFGESTIPGYSPDFQTGQFGSLSETTDPGPDADFAERTQTDLVMPPAQMHDDDAAERMSSLLVDCLTVLDDLDKLLGDARSLGADAKLIVELDGTRTRFLHKLGAYDVEQRSANGEPVDLALHEVVREEIVTDEAKHGKIVSVDRPGYVQYGQSLRRARVVVGKKA